MLYLDRRIGGRILIQDAYGNGAWLRVCKVQFSDSGEPLVTLSIDGDRDAIRVTREELLRRDELPDV